LGDDDVTDATIFPDGRLLYLIDTALFAADQDGSNAHRLAASISRHDSIPGVSADGHRLVFSDTNTRAHKWAISRAASDGSDVRPILNSGQGLPDRVSNPQWTPDGNHVIFIGQGDGRWDLWTVPSSKGLLHRSSPARLTNGPISYESFIVSRDGKKIFAIGALRRGEFVRYDPSKREFVPYLGGISAYDVTFSKDGKWMAYLSYPGHTLWRCRADGSDRRQLTFVPMLAGFPRISPDGRRVAFTGSDRRAYLMGTDGGAPEKITDDPAVAPDWSPDGNLLAVTSAVSPAESTAKGTWRARIIDVRTGNASVVPESQGTMGPWFANQETLIAASEDQSKFLLFDFKTKKWTDLITVPDRLVSWVISPDHNYLVYATGGNDARIFRMKLSDHNVDEIASLKNFRAVNDPSEGVQVSVGPDNLPLLTRDLGTEEVYALSLKWP